MFINDVLAIAKAKKEEEDILYPGKSPYKLDWYVDRTIRGLPADEFVRLLLSTVDLPDFMETAVSSGGTIRSTLFHGLVLDRVIDALDDDK